MTKAERLEDNDQEFIHELIKRANDGIEARRLLTCYYPGLVNIITVAGEEIPVDDALGAETDLADEFVLVEEVKDVQD